VVVILCAFSYIPGLWLFSFYVRFPIFGACGVFCAFAPCPPPLCSPAGSRWGGGPAGCRRPPLGALLRSKWGFSVLAVRFIFVIPLISYYKKSMSSILNFVFLS